MRLLDVGGQVQISEDHLATPQLGSFRRKRLFDLYDQLSSFEYLVGSWTDSGTSGSVFIVANARTITRASLDPHIVPPGNQFADGRGNEPDSVFVRFYFFRNTNEHGSFPTLCVPITASGAVGSEEVTKNTSCEISEKDLLAKIGAQPKQRRGFTRTNGASTSPLRSAKTVSSRGWPQPK